MIHRTRYLFLPNPKFPYLNPIPTLFEKSHKTSKISFYKGLVNVYSKPSIFRNIFLKIEKVINTFSISEKTFPKMINYCVPLRYTLVKFFL